MFFIIDKERKIIFGWSAKCGCTHIKSIYHYLQNDVIKTKNIHGKNMYGFNQKIPNIVLNSINTYTTIIITRNPYKRLVSGFLNKYGINGEYRQRWPSKNMKFHDFVNQLGNWRIIDRHHFTPQTSEAYTDVLLKSRTIKVFDIERINYDYIENLYKKKIPLELLKFKGDHTRSSIAKKSEFNKYVFDLGVREYYHSKVNPMLFYNNDLKKKVYEFYKYDFILLRKFGLDYTI